MFLAFKKKKVRKNTSGLTVVSANIARATFQFLPLVTEDLCIAQKTNSHPMYKRFKHPRDDETCAQVFSFAFFHFLCNLFCIDFVFSSFHDFTSISTFAGSKQKSPWPLAKAHPIRGQCSAQRSLRPWYLYKTTPNPVGDTQRVCKSHATRQAPKHAHCPT